MNAYLCRLLWLSIRIISGCDFTWSSSNNVWFISLKIQDARLRMALEDLTCYLSSNRLFMLLLTIVFEVPQLALVHDVDWKLPRLLLIKLKMNHRTFLWWMSVLLPPLTDVRVNEWLEHLLLPYWLVRLFAVSFVVTICVAVVILCICVDHSCNY